MSCPVSFSRHRFARTCSRCSRPRICSPPRRTACRPARRSTRRSTIRPTFSPRPSLDNRASDINNLLDGIGNGVQVLQAANTGITSLQKLVDTAKSIANQVLQAPVGYSTKSSVTSGANAGGNVSQPARRYPCPGRRPDDRSDRRRHGIEHHVRYRRGRSQHADRAQCGSWRPTTCRLRWTTPPAGSRSPRPTMRLPPPSARSAVPRLAPARRSWPLR